MAEQILHGSNVVTAAEQGRRERVAEGVRCGGLRDACLLCVGRCVGVVCFGDAATSAGSLASALIAR